MRNPPKAPRPPLAYLLKVIDGHFKREMQPTLSEQFGEASWKLAKIRARQIHRYRLKVMSRRTDPRELRRALHLMDILTLRPFSRGFPVAAVRLIT